MKTMWRLWAKALGQKASDNDRESDYIAHIRTLIFITYFITNLFICAGVIRHWNDVPSNLPKTQEKGFLSSNSNISQN